MVLIYTELKESGLKRVDFVVVLGSQQIDRLFNLVSWDLVSASVLCSDNLSPKECLVCGGWDTW